MTANSQEGLPNEPRVTPEYSRFTELVAAERYAEAETLAASMLDRQTSDWAFWKTQMGYVCFLNEADAAAQFERAPHHFRELAARFPRDLNARFWSGYIALVILDELETGCEELQSVVQMMPEHQYALLVLGGVPGNVDQAIRYLEASLRVEGRNFRALRDLGRLYDQLGRREEARAMFEQIVKCEPVIERDFGVMNEYMNDVLTGAAHAEAWKTEARRYLSIRN